MELITFLEDAPYPATTFVWQNRRWQGHFAPAASARFWKPDRLLVFLTQQAQAKVWGAFQSELPDGLETRQVLIPPGATQMELWLIARTVASEVSGSEDLVFDLSHGPLCFPLVGLMTAIYLRVARHAELRAVLYASYGLDVDADGPVKPGETPIHDLSVMLMWLNWYAAIDRLERTGDASDLAALVQAERKRLARQAQGNPDVMAQLGGLGKLSGVLNSISSSLLLIRPRQAMQHISDLPERVQAAEPLFQDRPAALAFALLNRAVDNLSPLALANPDAPQNARSVLDVERRMILWYAERGLWVQVATLAREWVISWTMFQFGLEKFTHYQSRQRFEHVLGAEARDYQEAQQKHQPYKPLFLADLPAAEGVLGLWNALTDARNDINHAGMRDRPGRPEDLAARIQTCIQTLSALPLA